VPTTLRVIRHKKWFRYYTKINTYVELARRIADDHVLWDFTPTDEDTDWRCLLWLCEDEERLKAELKEEGWRVSKGIGIAL
jgi:hypothetical protein